MEKIINKILEHQTILKNIYYEKMDKLREEFDFNNPTPTFEKLKNYIIEMETELIRHFEFQEELRNSKTESIILENMLVKEILLRMCQKIFQGAVSQNPDIFQLFEDFEEIFKAYLAKERGRFIQELKEVL